MPSVMLTIPSAIAGPVHSPIRSQCKPNAVPKDMGTPTYVTLLVAIEALLRVKFTYNVIREQADIATELLLSQTSQ